MYLISQILTSYTNLEEGSYLCLTDHSKGNPCFSNDYFQETLIISIFETYWQRVKFQDLHQNHDFHKEHYHFMQLTINRSKSLLWFFFILAAFTSALFIRIN